MTKKCCGNCVHFNIVAGMQRTGVCDENTLNKRYNVPVVLSSSDEVCWRWEKDIYGYVNHQNTSKQNPNELSGLLVI